MPNVERWVARCLPWILSWTWQLWTLARWSLLWPRWRLLTRSMSVICWRLCMRTALWPTLGVVDGGSGLVTLFVVIVMKQDPIPMLEIGSDTKVLSRTAHTWNDFLLIDACCGIGGMSHGALSFEWRCVRALSPPKGGNDAVHGFATWVVMALTPLGSWWLFWGLHLHCYRLRLSVLLSWCLCSVYVGSGRCPTLVLMLNCLVLCWVHPTQRGYVAKQCMWQSSCRMVVLGLWVRRVSVPKRCSPPSPFGGNHRRWTAYRCQWLQCHNLSSVLLQPTCCLRDLRQSDAESGTKWWFGTFFTFHNIWE